MPSLPEWPSPATADLVTFGADGTGDVGELHAIPVSAPVRADERTILLSLHHSRDSLARLRARPEVALLVRAEGCAFTAHGTARIAARAMAGAPDWCAVEISVSQVDDHREGGRESRDGLEDRLGTLRQLAAVRQRCRVAAGGLPTDRQEGAGPRPGAG
ncbi:hypothetical protein [Streptacidiphilus carbonis]|uniref:hypothetical protein n=1 Tax=Streptacidiphilus carbonis TaxID=105422 RepID=UPI00069362F8|nr:hypothetical protein [Streptacidiphilus carbonis]